jgi:RNA polymerase sigma factor (sigma-70 family)
MATIQTDRVIERLCKALRAGGAGLSDGQLLTCFVERRDEAAFEALVRRHGPMVLGACRRVLRSHHDAEDAFQATFLVLARKAASIKSPEALGNWLYGVAYNVAQKARSINIRRQARERQVAAMPEPEAVREECPADDLRPLLDHELSRLPEKYRLPVVLCDLEGRPRKDVARHLNIVEGTLSSRLTTARTLLSRRLARGGLLPSAGALAAALSPSAASSCVPASLVAFTVKGAIAFATGRAAAGGVISTPVTILTERVLKAMLMTKLKLAAVFVLSIGLILAGSAIANRALTAEPDAPRAPEGGAAGGAGHGPEPAPADNPAGQQAGAQTAKESKVRALLKERLTILRERASALREQHKSGVAALEPVQEADLRVYRAELDLCESDKERVWVHEKIVAVLREMEKRVADLRKAAAAPEADVTDAKLNRLEAEIALERAKEKIASQPR